MASKSKWYAQGEQDARDGFYDPPWSPGHRDHTRYSQGYSDAMDEQWRKAKRELEEEHSNEE